MHAQVTGLAEQLATRATKSYAVARPRVAVACLLARTDGHQPPGGPRRRAGREMAEFVGARLQEERVQRSLELSRGATADSSELRSALESRVSEEAFAAALKKKVRRARARDGGRVECQSRVPCTGCCERRCARSRSGARVRVCGHRAHMMDEPPPPPCPLLRACRSAQRPSTRGSLRCGTRCGTRCRPRSSASCRTLLSR